MAIPAGLAGTVTIVFLVGCGIFLYPWLLARPHGALAVAALTVALAALFYSFDSARGSSVSAAVFGVLWALLPVATAMLVKGFRDRAAKAGKREGASGDARG